MEKETKTNSSKGNFLEILPEILLLVFIVIIMSTATANRVFCVIALLITSFIIYRSWKKIRQKSKDLISNGEKETSAQPKMTGGSGDSSATKRAQVKKLTESEQKNLFTGVDSQQKVKEYIQIYPLSPEVFAYLLGFPYNGDILEMYAGIWGIPDEYASDILELPNAKKLITVNKNKLPVSAVLKMYTLPNSLELFESYVTNWDLLIVEELAMYEQTNAADLVAIFLKYGSFESRYAEKKMLYLPNALELFALCIQKTCAFKGTVKEIFKLSDAAKFAEILISNDGCETGFEYEDYLNLLKLPNAKDLLLLLMQHGYNSDELTDAILASPYAAELVIIFDAKGGEFDEEQQVKLFNLDVKEVQMKYLRDPEVCEEVENAALTSPYAEDLLGRIIAEKHELKWNTSEVLMCQMPNAEKFVKAYTDYAKLCYEAEAYARVNGWL